MYKIDRRGRAGVWVQKSYTRKDSDTQLKQRDILPQTQVQGSTPAKDLWRERQ